MKVLVVDDHSTVRQTICNLLLREHGVEVAEQAATAQEGLEKIRGLHPDEELGTALRSAGCGQI